MVFPSPCVCLQLKAVVWSSWWSYCVCCCSPSSAASSTSCTRRERSPVDARANRKCECGLSLCSTTGFILLRVTEHLNHHANGDDSKRIYYRERFSNKIAVAVCGMWRRMYFTQSASCNCTPVVSCLGVHALYSRILFPVGRLSKHSSFKTAAYLQEA